MSDLETLGRIQAFLAAPAARRRPSTVEIVAWEDFFQIHDPLIRSAVKRRDMSSSDVDDLVQDIWAILIRRLPKLDLDPERGTLHGWVTSVARHHASRYHRRHMRRRHESLTPELATTLFDRAVSPMALMEREQQRALVNVAIADLVDGMPEFKRQVIVAYWVEEQTISAIVLTLGASAEHVWSTIRRARPVVFRCLRRAGLDIEVEKNQKKSEKVDR